VAATLFLRDEGKCHAQRFASFALFSAPLAARPFAIFQTVRGRPDRLTHFLLRAVDRARLTRYPLPEVRSEMGDPGAPILFIEAKSGG